MIDFGMTAEEFRARLMDQQVHIYRRALLEPSLSWSDLNSLLHQIEPVEPLFQLFSEGLIPADKFTDEVVELGLQRRRINKERFYRYMANGASLVLNRLELSSPAARRLSDQIGHFTGQTTTGGNGYLTFAGRGSPTFGKHWDVHDVFAIQLIGSKRWQVYPPTFPFPLLHHTNSAIRDQCPATPVIDCVLQPGDMLYIPRGWWHHVTPPEEASFHLSIGTFVPTVMDYVLWCCNGVLQAQAVSRKGLGAGITSSEDIAEAMQLASVAALNPDHLAEFMKTIAERRQQPAVEIDLSLIADPRGQHLSGNEIVRLNPLCEFNMQRAEAVFNGKRITLDQNGAAILKPLHTSGPMSLEALCQLAAPLTQLIARSTLVNLAKHDIILIGNPH